MKKLSQYSSAGKISTGPRLYNRGQRYDQSHYSFLQSDEEDDKGEEFFLQARSKEFLEKELEPGDTLQTLSIQFNCPIAELKRVNNIHKENEVFARRIIKVPTRYYSFLNEKVAGVHKKPDHSSSSSINSIEDPQTSTISRFSIQTLINSEHNPPSNIGQVLETDGELVIKDANPLADSNEFLSTSSLLPPSPVITRDTTATVFECNGSDGGLSWLHLIICILLFLFGGPILYLLYHRVEPTRSNSPTFVNSTSPNL